MFENDAEFQQGSMLTKYSAKYSGHQSTFNIYRGFNNSKVYLSNFTFNGRTKTSLYLTTA